MLTTNFYKKSTGMPNGFGFIFKRIPDPLKPIKEHPYLGVVLCYLAYVLDSAIVFGVVVESCSFQGVCKLERTPNICVYLCMYFTFNDLSHPYHSKSHCPMQLH